MKFCSWITYITFSCVEYWSHNHWQWPTIQPTEQQHLQRRRVWCCPVVFWITVSLLAKLKGVLETEKHLNCFVQHNPSYQMESNPHSNVGMLQRTAPNIWVKHVQEVKTLSTSRYLFTCIPLVLLLCVASKYVESCCDRHRMPCFHVASDGQGAHTRNLAVLS